MYCAICRGSGTVERAYRFHGASSPFRDVLRAPVIYRCDICGLRQVDVAAVDPAGLETYYAAVYRSQTSLGRGNDLHFERRANAICSAVAPWAPQGGYRNIFEIGAGLGHNLRALARAYPAARCFTDEPGQGLFRADERQSLTAEPRDLVVMSHVLEHMSDPLATISEVSAALRPGGVLYLEVPNQSSPMFESEAYDEPHVMFFEANPLRAAIEASAAEMKILKIGAAGPHYMWRLRGNPWRKLLRVTKRLATTGANLVLYGKPSACSLPGEFAFRRGGIWLRMLARKE